MDSYRTDYDGITRRNGKVVWQWITPQILADMMMTAITGAYTTCGRTAPAVITGSTLWLRNGDGPFVDEWTRHLGLGTACGPKRERFISDMSPRKELVDSLFDFLAERMDSRTDDERAEHAAQEAESRHQAEQQAEERAAVRQEYVDSIKPGDELVVQWRPMGGGRATAKVCVLSVEGDYLRVASLPNRNHPVGKTWNRRVSKSKVLEILRQDRQQ